MSYQSLNDPKGAAKFLAGIQFTVLGTSPSERNPEATTYHCLLRVNGGERAVNCNWRQGQDAGPTVADAIRPLLYYASLANGTSLYDFVDKRYLTELPPSENIKMYETCKEQLDWCENTLGLSSEELDGLSLALEDNIGEVKEALAATLAEREAEHERTHPMVPEGFVAIEDLQAGLDLGDYGDQLIEYDGDISDAIMDCADSNIDIYSHDLLHWLPDNYEWLEEADAQGLLEGAKGDIFKMTQMAQYECFSQDMYDHQEDIVKYATIESLKDAGIYAISLELADALDTEVDYKAADTFEGALDEAKEQIQSLMATSLAGALGDEELAEEAAEQLVGSDGFSTVNPTALSVEAVHAVNEWGFEEAFAERWFWKDRTEQAEPEMDSPSLDSMNRQCSEACSALGQDGPSHELRQER